MLVRPEVVLGADPEFFFENNNRIVESAKVVPEKGIQVPFLEERGSNIGTIIRDGFQGEFNLHPHTCRESFAHMVRSLFMKVKGMGYKVKLGAGYWVPDTMFADLTRASKEFGCVPSFNTYGEETEKKDAATYMFRPAGGHIHLGVEFAGETTRIKRLVRVLDVLLGNSAVCVDQDELQVERRLNYGRAGEYRIKPYGVEYRTLSNFWLGNNRKLSFALGLARQAVTIEYHGLSDELLALVDESKIREAINNNDKGLALANFEAIVPFINKHFNVNDEYELELHTLTDETVDAFRALLVSADFKSADGEEFWIDYIKSNGSMGGGIEKFLLRG